jgi:hypothetical protein
MAAIVLALEAVVGETTTVAIHGSRANRAGSFSNTIRLVKFEDMPAGLRTESRGPHA